MIFNINHIYKNLNNKQKMILNKRIYFLLSTSILNTILFLIFLTYSLYVHKAINFFLYLTIWNLLITTKYLWMVTSFEMNGREYKTIYNKLLIQRISKIIFTMNFSVLMGFWTLTMLGNDVIQWRQGTSFFMRTVYLHFILQFIVFIEIATNNTNRLRYFDLEYNKKYLFVDFVILTLSFLFYAVVLVYFSRLETSFRIYAFLNKSYGEILLYLFFLFFYVLVGYSLYIVYIIKLNKKNKYTAINNRVEYDENFNTITKLENSNIDHNITAVNNIYIASRENDLDSSIEMKNY